MATLQWLREQLDDFALKPGGTELAVLFWASAAAGFVLTRRRLLGSIAAAVVFSGVLFAVLRLVPLYERLSLWFVPALYLGVALFADSAASLMRQSRGRWGWISGGIAAAAAIVTFQVCSDVFRHGVDDLRNFRPVGSNRSTDDRTAILWLMNHRQPGDVVVTTRLGLPAVLWYGDGGPILSPNIPRRNPSAAPRSSAIDSREGRGCSRTWVSRIFRRGSTISCFGH